VQHWGHEFDLSGSRDVIGHVIIWFAISYCRRPYNLYCVGADVKPCSINQSTISYWWSFGTKALSPTVSEIFSGECDETVHMILNDL